MYSLAWAQIWPPSSDTSTRWPRPVRSRAISAASTPLTRFSEAMWSAIVMAIVVGSPSSVPVALISPPDACADRSAPSRSASGPIGPNAEPVAYTSRGLRAERSS